MKKMKYSSHVIYNKRHLSHFSPESVVIVALNCSLVPSTTAWSTGRSFDTSSLFVDSRYNATSYSKGPGDSSTTPETRAAYGLFQVLEKNGKCWNAFTKYDVLDNKNSNCTKVHKIC